MAQGDRKDPYLSFRFVVEIDNKVAAGFSEVTGLQVEIETEEYREGGENRFIHKFAGKTRYPSQLVLKHGIVDSHQLWDWQHDIAQGKIKRKNVSVILKNSGGEEKLRWDFEQAYPVRWSGPDFRANSAEVGIETLELTHRGFAKN
jgi:phage tail-like protein